MKFKKGSLFEVEADMDLETEDAAEVDGDALVRGIWSKFPHPLVADPAETRGDLGFLKLRTNLLKAQISQLEPKKQGGFRKGRGNLE